MDDPLVEVQVGGGDFRPAVLTGRTLAVLDGCADRLASSESRVPGGMKAQEAQEAQELGDS